MSTAKKTSREKAPQPSGDEHVIRRSSENQEKGKVQRVSVKPRRVNYVVKDLPIY
jgi:hypothetical protein